MNSEGVPSLRALKMEPRVAMAARGDATPSELLEISGTVDPG